MDRSRYYSAFQPVETNVAVLLNADTTLATEKYNRVCLFIATSATADNLFISTKKMTGAGQGRLVNAQTGPAVFYWKSDGPLVGQNWHGFSAAAIQVNVLELVGNYDPYEPLGPAKGEWYGQAEPHQQDNQQRNGFRDLLLQPQKNGHNFLPSARERLRDQFHWLRNAWRWNPDTGWKQGVDPAEEGFW